MDLSVIIKCLEMSASSNDGEALNAIRKANLLLKKEGKNWTDVLTERRNGASPPSKGFSPSSPDEQKIINARNEMRILASVLLARMGSYRARKDRAVASKILRKWSEGMGINWSEYLKLKEFYHAYTK